MRKKHVNRTHWVRPLFHFLSFFLSSQALRFTIEIIFEPFFGPSPFRHFPDDFYLSLIINLFISWFIYIYFLKVLHFSNNTMLTRTIHGTLIPFATGLLVHRKWGQKFVGGSYESIIPLSAARPDLVVVLQFDKKKKLDWTISKEGEYNSFFQLFTNTTATTTNTTNTTTILLLLLYYYYFVYNVLKPLVYYFLCSS